MATYIYPRSIPDLQLLTGRVEHDVGVPPEGASSGSGGETRLDFAADLTVPQLASLNALMVLPNPDTIHASTGTRFRVRDIYRLRAFLQAQFGVTFTIYPRRDDSEGGYFIVFDVALNAQQRNAFRDLWTNLLVLL